MTRLIPHAAHNRVSAPAVIFPAGLVRRNRCGIASRNTMALRSSAADNVTVN